MKKIIISILILFNSVAWAEKIMFPEEELAKEWALPIFDRPLSVKNRLLVKSNRTEVGAMMGMALGEAFYNSGVSGFNLNYYINEDNGAGLYYLNWGKGLSSYGEQLDKNFQMKFKYTPAPTNVTLLRYLFTGYYGKLSLTKKSVLQLTTFIDVGMGTISFGSTSFMATSLGLGQKLYFTKSFSIFYDFRLLFSQGPNPVKPNSGDQSKLTQAASADEFEKQSQTKTFLTIGGSFMF